MNSTRSYKDIIIETCLMVTSAFMCYFIITLLGRLCRILIALKVHLLRNRMAFIPDLVSRYGVGYVPPTDDDDTGTEPETDVEDDDDDDDEADGTYELHNRINRLEYKLQRNNSRYDRIICRMNIQLERLISDNDNRYW